MSDGGDSIFGGIADEAKTLGEEAISSITPKNIFKTIIGQVIGKNLTAEEESKKQADAIAGQRRIQEIEAEMQSIRAEREKMTGPQITGSEENSSENINQQSQDGPQVEDINLQRIQTKVEGDGRANKG